MFVDNMSGRKSVCRKDVRRKNVGAPIFDNWFCKFGIPAQIHTDGGTEFVNKMADELFVLLNVDHTRTSPAHPQCNAQVEVFNKTVKKYLASFTDKTTLDWELFIPSLNLAYNTSYHSTIQTTPFELLFGVKPRLPSFPNPDIERVHYGEDFASERLQILNKARQIARQNATQNQMKYKTAFDDNAKEHCFNIGDKVLYMEMSFLNKNQKLAPKWSGPVEIIDVNDTNVKVRTPKGKIKLLNVMRIKKFFEEDGHAQNEEHYEELDLPTNTSRPMTRALSKLIKQRQATSIAINLINEALWPDIIKVAQKFLISDSTTLNDLTPEEQELWNSVDKSDLYEALTGDPEEVPNFQYDWITPSDTLTIQVPVQPHPASESQRPKRSRRPLPPPADRVLRSQQQPTAATSDNTKQSSPLQQTKNLAKTVSRATKSVFQFQKIRQKSRAKGKCE